MISVATQGWDFFGFSFLCLFYATHSLRRKMLRDQMQQKFMESAEPRDSPNGWLKSRALFRLKLKIWDSWVYSVSTWIVWKPMKSPAYCLLISCNAWCIYRKSMEILWIDWPAVRFFLVTLMPLHKRTKDTRVRDQASDHLWTNIWGCFFYYQRNSEEFCWASYDFIVFSIHFLQLDFRIGDRWQFWGVKKLKAGPTFHLEFRGFDSTFSSTRDPRKNWWGWWMWKPWKSPGFKER